MSSSRRSKTNQWHKRQEADCYVRLARATGYRSRSAYKLLAMDQSAHLLCANQVVVDLGSAPGGWSQVIAQKVGNKGQVVAVDRAFMSPIEGVDFICGDCRDDKVLSDLVSRLGRAADLVVSDISPDLTGIAVTDQENALLLATPVMVVARRCLHHKGRLLLKAFEGSARCRLNQLLATHFKKTQILRPVATRRQSREFYYLASDFVG